MENPHWPLFGLRIRTPRLELRYPDDALLTRVATVAGAGIHDPALMPFGFPWTDAPSPELERNVLRHGWRSRAEFGPEHWAATFAVLVEGRPVGQQTLRAHEFPVRREVDSGSWLGQPHQGRGYGKEMRAAVLHLAFAGLGAEWATSGAFFDNPASQKVSAALGYEPDGMDVKQRRGVATVMYRLRLSRSNWEAHRPPYDIEIQGLDACRELFGAAA